ncbi:ABC transporter ATP-binding protein/permease [Parafrankia sp. Ea1.12]|uniref:ATP-binding cassette domain-containing protein n=1 Tax=Parafrankia sp. Ea1.12 TaxID=573499 RepID=UPI001F221BF0|nr:ABC transporter ATP-binding protein/permease [Parafrankia sp. Ea1.12]
MDLHIRRGTSWGGHAGHGGREIVHGLSFEVPRGSVTGVIGPSGCGKTTLMRAVVGIQRGVSGELRVLGLDACEIELRRRVGYATQTASVYDDLTVDENLRYFAALSADRVLSPAEIIRRAERAASGVGLATEGRTPVGQLSGGQRSRVSLAAAIIGGHELLVLDEPTVGLDPVLRRELWDEFHRMADRGLTLLVSSHVMDEAARCDRLLLLREGRLIADEKPADLLALTGAGDLDHAFLCLVESSAPACADSPVRGDAPPPRDSPRLVGASRASDAPSALGVPRTRGTPEARGRNTRQPLNLARTSSTALRVIRQMRRDRRTVLLVLVLPPTLLGLLQAIFANSPTAFDRAGTGLLGVFPLMTMFFLTSVAMLRERRSGTLERLMTTPIGRGDLLAGYGIAFGLLAVAQAVVTTTTAVVLLDLHIAGPLPVLGLLAVLAALFGTALGLLTSAFANSEFQAVQFLPPVLLPQFLLCGILVAQSQLHPVLATVSFLLPMTYVVDALTRIGASPGVPALVVRDALVIAACTLVALALAAATLRRQGP